MRGVFARFGARKVLDRVDLVVPVPGLVGIVGASGAGKSTLVHTILGLVRASGGAITFGDHALASSPVHAWRRQMGYVPQETILFHASVWDNVSLAKPDASATEIETAARRAHAHDFITALPHGYKTIIGDQGVALSGGQRQRLGIARALLGEPKILLMDEALNALDAESEAELLRTIEELRRQVGVLIIAHRLATVRTADCVCVLEAGRVIETGTWDELMARRARLFTLVETQSSVDRRSPAIQNT
jgi:ABC-type multidrug transport system fused ATPase/permease subunit